MSETVRCPSICCWPSFDTGQLAFDGHFRCTHCGEHLSRGDFALMLKEIDGLLEEWRSDIASLLARRELND